MYIASRTKMYSACYRGDSGKVLWEVCSAEKFSVPAATFHRFKKDWEMWECDLGLYAGNSKLQRQDPVSADSLIWSHLLNRKLVAYNRMNLWLWENLGQVEGCSWFWSLFQSFPEFYKTEKGAICNTTIFMFQVVKGFGVVWFLVGGLFVCLCFRFLFVCLAVFWVVFWGVLFWFLGSLEVFLFVLFCFFNFRCQ